MKKRVMTVRQRKEEERIAKKNEAERPSRTHTYELPEVKHFDSVRSAWINGRKTQ
jgi:hypothetical protein